MNSNDSEEEVGDEGSPLEIILLSSALPMISSLLYMFVDSFLMSKNRHVIHAHSVNAFTLLLLTLWSGHVTLLSLLVIIGVFGMIIYLMCSTYSCEKPTEKISWISFLKGAGEKFQDLEIEPKSSSLPYLTAYRGSALLGTVISILAVDFSAFPSRFSKTESFGWSLMDVGVGGFVAIHGMCSAQARGKHVGGLWKEMKSSILLLVLGLLRLAAVKAVGYHQNVLEYGVHWNFFFTLGITKILCSFLYSIIPSATSIYFTLLLGMLHQHAMSNHGLTGFILSDKRDGFVAANKEGILSLPGFMFIHLVSVELGKHFNKPRCKMKDYIYLLCELVVMGVCGWHCTMMLDEGIQPVSRRMANISYCVWMLSFTCILVAMHLVEVICLAVYQRHVHCRSGFYNSKVIYPSVCLWEALNYNGLFYFLAGNILTGIVNMVMDTSQASELVSYIVLSLYSVGLCGVTILLKEHSIRVKI